MKTQDGKLTIVSGKSRSGKSAYVVDKIKRKRRVVVWDVEAQFCELSGFIKVTDRRTFLNLINKKGALKLAFVSAGDLKKDFDFFCDCVLYAGRHVEPLCVVCEELADVTSQAKAPLSWGMLSRRGLKRGIDIFAISQRWQEADKTALGNASFFVMFQQSTGDDALYMAKKTRVPLEAINTLKTFHYVVYDTSTGEYKTEKLNFAK